MSSSAPAENLWRGVAASLTGGLALRLAVLASLHGSDLFHTAALRLPTALLVDATVASALLLLVRWRRLHLVGVVGIAFGVMAAIDVGFVLTTGAPFTPALLSYARDVGPAHVPATAWLGAGAAIVAVVVAALLAPRFKRTIAFFTVALFVLGAIARVVDDRALRRTMGIDTHPVVALFAAPTTATTTTTASTWRMQVPPPRKTQNATPPRHIVLVVMESIAARYVTAETMPRLTTLSQTHAVRFDDHTAESPLSIKALFSITCGLAPLPDAALETKAIPRIDCKSLPEQLSAAGYRSGLFHGGYFAFTDKLALFSERGFVRTVDGETAPAHAWRNGWGADDRVIAGEALRFLDDAIADDARSFSFIVPLIPHYEYFLPNDADTPFGTSSIIARYKNGLRFADGVLGMVVDGYAQRGVLDDTLFVVVGDHGEAFDEHPHNRLHGSFVYEENIRTPLLFMSTALFPEQGQTSMAPSTHKDLLPTILSLAGVERALPHRSLADLAGRSLFDDAPYGPTFHHTHIPKPHYALRMGPDTIVYDEGGDSEVIARRDQHRARLTNAPTLGVTYMHRVAAQTTFPLVQERVFNMARPCLRIATTTSAPTVVELSGLSPPARRVGIGVTDHSRRERRGGLDVTINGVARTINDVFETSSTVIELDGAERVVITLPPSPRTAQACLWLAP